VRGVIPQRFEKPIDARCACDYDFAKVSFDGEETMPQYIFSLGLQERVLKNPTISEHEKGKISVPYCTKART